MFRSGSSPGKCQDWREAIRSRTSWREHDHVGVRRSNQGPQFLDKRKGFVDKESSASPEDAGSHVLPADGFNPFPLQVKKSRICRCVLRAVGIQQDESGINLTTLAFAESGSEWSDTDVKTSDPDGALAFAY